VKGLFAIAILVTGLVFSANGYAQDDDAPDAPVVESDKKEDAPSPIEVKQKAWGALGLKGQIECRRNLGVAGGLVYIGGSWDFVGQGPIAFTGSPIFSMMCDGGWDMVAISFGMETAPFYVHRTFNVNTVEQLISASVGVVMGNDSVRYGPMASVGYGYAGGGLRAMWMPWETKKGVRRGFEARVLAWLADEVSVQASLQFHLSAKRQPFRLRGKK